jgi:hypothetical protein
MKWWVGSGLGVGLVMLTVASADARVKREGAWPDADRPVTLDLDDVPRRDALRKLADAAGWSLVVHAPAGDKVDIHVKAQPASKVMEILLDDGDYTVKRDGTLLSVEPTATTAPAGPAAAAPAPASAAPPGAASAARPAPPVLPGSAAAPVPPAPPAPPAAPAPVDSPGMKDVQIQLGSKGATLTEPHKRGADKTVAGGNVTIGAGETVRDLTVYGGNVDIAGQVTGDLTVFGGTAHLREGAGVHGDAEVFGGELHLDRGAHIDGDVSCVGGDVRRDPGSVVSGDITVKGGHDVGNTSPDDEEASHAATVARHEHRDAHVSALRGLAESFLGSVRLTAVLFVIGTVLLALSGRRMEQLRGEVALRPMRSIAMGLVGLAASIVILIALTVTVIGAPVALVLAMFAGFAVLGAMCAVLSVAGEALLRHKTENPYVHLAVGCALFVALASIPWVGYFVIFGVMLAGVGILVATRGAGFFVKKNGSGGGVASYRSSAAV